MINGFTVYLIISKLLRRQKSRQKKMTQKDVKAKTKLSKKVFSFV